MKLRATALIITLTLGLGLLVAPLPAEAQQAGKVYRVGALASGSRAPTSHLRKALEEGLRDLGYVKGRNITIEYRFAEGKLERLPELAAELVRLKVDIITPLSTPAAIAAKHATTTIPIAMVSPADPVSAGLIASLARPGGNLTGLTMEVTLETWGKYLQLLKEAVPNIRRLAILWNPDYQPNAARWRAMQEAAPKLGVVLLSAEVRGANDIESAFATMIRERADGVFVVGGPVVFSLRGQIAGVAAQNRLPAMSTYREHVKVGGLMSYGVDFRNTYRRAATFIDKILKGAKPADLPVEQPRELELVLNLKTAKALGITFPDSILIRADKVIE